MRSWNDVNWQVLQHAVDPALEEGEDDRAGDRDDQALRGVDQRHGHEGGKLCRARRALERAIVRKAPTMPMTVPSSPSIGPTAAMMPMPS